ncbi:hypothetical protein ACHAWF_014507 [Thalassiosira exigua]
MPGLNLKAKLARAFLGFLDEHGNYRSQLEEAAARAAAAEANSLFARDRRGRKKKRRKRGRRKLKDGEEGPEEYEYEEYEDDDDEEGELLPPPILPPKHPPLPEDPYEQIQFYFRTFTHRTKLQIEERLDVYRTRSVNWVHDELHHPERVPALSGSMLAALLLLCAIRARGRKIAGAARVHGILGKKLDLKDYLHANFVKGRVMLQWSDDGQKALEKMIAKARKAEAAALAAARPYQKKKYERLARLERWGERTATFCLILGTIASGTALALSLRGLYRGDRLVPFDGAATFAGEDRLDGHLYSLDGPLDSDGYPLGANDEAEESYAACLAEAESRGADDLSAACDVESFFPVVETGNEAAASSSSSSPLRAKVRAFLVAKLRVPPSLADYLASLRSQTLAYLSSLVTFLLFVVTHYLAHKIHVAASRHDPMQHFVLSATDKSVKSDGTVEAKRGETEAQRKRRERMLQNERLKAKMAQLAAEAKQKVEERRKRIEGKAAAEQEQEEEEKKVVEEQEEIVKCHSRQFGMLKAGVPEGAVLNSLAAEGLEDEEAKEVVERLKAVKVRRAAEARKAEEAEAKKAEREKEEEEEKERVVKERLRTMKSQRSTGNSASRRSGVAGSSNGNGGAELKKRLDGRKAAGVPSPASTPASSVASASTGASTDPSAARSAMLGQIGQGGLKRSSTGASTDPSAARSAMLGQIGRGGLKPSSQRKLPTKPSKSPVRSNDLSSGNLPVGVKGDKRWDRETKAWVAVTNAAIGGGPSPGGASPGPDRRSTPKRSNKGEGAGAGATPPRIPSRLKLSQLGGEDQEEKKGEEDSAKENDAAREARETIVAAARDAGPVATVPLLRPETAKKQVSELTSDGAEGDAVRGDDSTSDTPVVLVRISSSADCEGLVGETLALDAAPATPMDPFRRPSADDIQAQITAVENSPDEEGDVEGGKEVDLSPAWLHSPAFDMALRNSNASWDRRPSSRDIMGRIREVERLEQEGQRQQQQQQQQQRTPSVGVRPQVLPRSRSLRDGQRDDSLAIIDEKRDRVDHIEPSSSSEYRKKSSKSGGGGNVSDDEISELSEPTYVSNDDRRSVPRALFVPDKGQSPVPMSPMVMSMTSALSPAGRRSFVARDNLERLRMMAEQEELELPYPPVLENIDGKATNDAAKKEEGGKSSASVKSEEKSEATPIKVETEEEKKRRLRAEARAKKIEAIAACRNSGQDGDDDQSAVSGISKRRDRMRRKKKKLEAQALAATVQEEQSIKSEATSEKGSAAPKPETEEEKRRRKRAEARAKKLEAMAARRNAGKPENGDDASLVSGISKRHRIRRKKSALAAITTPEERWKRNVYSSVLNAERVRWQKSIYSNILNAEETRQRNVEKSRELEEQNAAAKRRLENQKRLDRKARKFAARAERFHRSRREGSRGDVDDDASSVVSSASRMRRRRGRKSSSMAGSVRSSIGMVEESAAQEMPMTAEEKERRERSNWCTSIYGSLLRAEQNQWKVGVYARVINAEGMREQRREVESQIERERAAAEARREKERQNEKRAKKMQRIHELRRDGDEDDADSVVSSMSRRRRRRGRKSAAHKASSADPSSLSTPLEESSASVPRELAEDAPVPPETEPELTPGQKEKQDRGLWCEHIYSYLLQSEQNRWTKDLFCDIIDSENARNKRLDQEAQMERERVAAEEQQEKERQNKLRLEKLEKIRSVRESADGEENIAPAQDSGNSVGKSVDSDVNSDAQGGSVSLMKNMRSRRKKAAKKKASK